jgi:P-type Ca2+ transporter type 2C
MHHLPIHRVAELLGTDIKKGLPQTKIAELQQKYWLNVLPQKKWFSIRKLIADQFVDVIVAILLVAATLSFILHEPIDWYIILGIVIINAILWFYQEFKAEKAIEKLSKSSSQSATVIRDGIAMMLPTKELVPWDMILFSAGDKFGADVRLIETHSVEVDESILTWESLPVEKIAERILEETTNVSERNNMAFSWTSVTKWTWIAIVIATWLQTQIGTIVDLLSQEKEEATPLEKKLTTFSEQVGAVVLFFSAVIFLLWWRQGKSRHEMFFIVVSLAVSSIPEWLVTVMTVTLAIWVQKLYKKNALVRKLKVIEALGTTTVICSDKTWTITQNHMTVTTLVINNTIYEYANKSIILNWKEINPTSISWLATYINTICNCNNAKLPNIWDPTEIALLECGQHFTPDMQEKTGEDPFDSDKKYMVTRHGAIEYMKWSVEAIVHHCNTYLLDWEKKALDKTQIDTIHTTNTSLAGQAIRVLWIAYKDANDTAFTYLWMIGMIDPPREEAIQAIQDCYKAWMRVIMITWDNIATAQAIAHKVWITWEAMLGDDFEASLEKDEIIRRVNIFARVSPKHKMMICETLQSLWESVVMTWDGVNDAAAIKAADIWFAMGISGTDVSKDAADIVLMDDNFASIVSTIKEWRIIYDNIRKFVKFMIAVNFDEMLRVMFNFLVWLPIPMTAIQLLRINLITDSVPAIALWFDKWDNDIMSQKPRSQKDWILSGSWWYVFYASIVSAVVGISLFYYYYTTVWLEVARTVGVVSWVFFELFLIFSVRHNSKPIRQIPANWFLTISVFVCIAIQVIVIHSPLWKVLDLTPLSQSQWIVSVCGWLVWVVFFELGKVLKLLHKKTANNMSAV